MGIFNLALVAVLVALIFVQHKKNKKQQLEMNKRLSELEVRIVVRVEDRLTILEEQAVLNSEAKINVLAEKG